jgi:hypothetical protein
MGITTSPSSRLVNFFLIVLGNWDVKNLLYSLTINFWVAMN